MRVGRTVYIPTSGDMLASIKADFLNHRLSRSIVRYRVELTFLLSGIIPKTGPSTLTYQLNEI